MPLLIRFHNKPCGLVDIQDERMSFSYLPAYRAENNPALSVSMPLREQPWPDSVCFPFLENLLPEGNVRQLLAKNLHTATNNFAKLLEKTGGDVAGAITLEWIEQETDPASLKPYSSEDTPLPPALTAQELGEVLERIKTQPFLNNNPQGMRLSLAGAQNKLPVVIDDAGQIHLPGHRPSTHIIKPPAEKFTALVENEYLCMRAAKRAGIRVPHVSLRPFIAPNEEPNDCYVIERYDRKTDAQGNTTRLHQEDLCQVLGIPSARKYSQDGGPGFGELFNTMRQHTTPAALHQQEFIKRILFNILIGNQDAHGKNFSILHGDTQVSLSPAYDLVSTQVYGELVDHFAMPLGAAENISGLCTETFVQFEQQTGINLRRQANMLKRFVSTANAALQHEAQLIKDETWPRSHHVIDQIVDLANHNAKTLDQWLS